MTYTTAADAAKNIRAAIKSQLGYTSRQISVKSSTYSMGSSIRVAIKVAGVDSHAVEAIANTEESVRRCEFSGEILSGGNRFVSVDYECGDIWADLYAAEAENALTEWEKLDAEQGAHLGEVDGVAVYVWRSGRDELYLAAALNGGRCCEIRQWGTREEFVAQIAQQWGRLVDNLVPAELRKIAAAQEVEEVEEVEEVAQETPALADVLDQLDALCGADTEFLRRALRKKLDA